LAISKPNVLHPQGCLHPEGEGYLAEESQALELDISRDSVHNRASVSFSFEGMRIPSSVLRLRLPAGSRKMDSSAQSCKEADSRQSLRSVLKE
ncbi:hypothetical protein, partial [Geobacillus stearothermophilus]|uniref:hypothetical protein n=1 Tax=Geobacillus stearothermophilus TaxID=1422 RepID=UPI002402D4FE